MCTVPQRAYVLQTDEQEVITFLLTTEIIPLCLRIMESGSELSKTVATFILQKILLDDSGLSYICQTYDRFSHVAMILVSSALYSIVVIVSWTTYLNPLNAELNPICHLVALLGAHHILHISRIKVKQDVHSILSLSMAALSHRKPATARN